MRIKDIGTLFKDTYQEWSSDKASMFGAAIAYYAIFSIAPLFVIAIAVAGFIYGEAAAQGKLVEQIQGFTGPQGAQMIQTMIQNASRPGAGITATITGVVILLFGASGVFVQLKQSLNAIWNVKEEAGGIKGMVKSRLTAFLLILGVGLLLLAMLLLSTIISAGTKYFAAYIPFSHILLRWTDLLITFVVATVLFAMLFKVLPDKEVRWSDVWVGAILTSLLFAIGKFAMGYYLGRGSAASIYGAAGSLIILLIWIYFSAQILLFGAEFTQVYAKRHGTWRERQLELDKQPRQVAAAPAAPVREERPALEEHPSREERLTSGEPRVVVARVHHGPTGRFSNTMAGVMLSALGFMIAKRALRKKHG